MLDGFPLAQHLHAAALPVGGEARDEVDDELRRGPARARLGDEREQSAQVLLVGETLVAKVFGQLLEQAQLVGDRRHRLGRRGAASAAKQL